MNPIIVKEIIDNKIDNKKQLYNFINKKFKVKVLEKENIFQCIKRIIFKDKLILDKNIINYIENKYKDNNIEKILKIYSFIDIILNNTLEINSLYKYSKDNQLIKPEYIQYEYLKYIFKKYNSNDIQIYNILKDIFKVDYKTDELIDSIESVLEQYIKYKNIKNDIRRNEKLKKNIMNNIEKYIKDLNKIIGKNIKEINQIDNLEIFKHINKIYKNKRGNFNYVSVIIFSFYIYYRLINIFILG